MHPDNTYLIERCPEICSGQPVFKGTRVTIMQVVEQLRAGVSLSEITADYPQLNSAALAYAQTQSRMGKPHGKSSVALNIKRSAS